MPWQKYFELYKRSFMKSLTYRGEVGLWFILDTLPVLISLLIWVSVYRQHQTIAGYDLPSILQYYVFVTLINTIVGTHFEPGRVQQIREGKIDFYLTRPLGYLSELVWTDFGGKSMYIIFACTSYFFVWSALSLFFPLPFPPLTFSLALVFAALLLFGYLVELFLACIIVLLGFWIEGADGLIHFKWITLTLFSGAMIPVALMPDWLQAVTRALPFQYLFAVPIGSLQQRLTVTGFDWLYMGTTLVFFYVIVKLLWKRAVYQYASHGG